MGIWSYTVCAAESQVVRNDRSCCRPASTRYRARKDVRDGSAVAARAGAGAVRGVLYLRGHRRGLAHHHSGKMTPRPIPLRFQLILWCSIMSRFMMYGSCRCIIVTGRVD